MLIVVKTTSIQLFTTKYFAIWFHHIWWAFFLLLIPWWRWRLNEPLHIAHNTLQTVIWWLSLGISRPDILSYVLIAHFHIIIFFLFNLRCILFRYGRSLLTVGVRCCFFFIFFFFFSTLCMNTLMFQIAVNHFSICSWVCLGVFSMCVSFFGRWWCGYIQRCLMPRNTHK